jgi:hypothetical protein
MNRHAQRPPDSHSRLHFGVKRLRNQKPRPRSLVRTLDTTGQVDGVADRGDAFASDGADATDNNVAVVDPDPHVEAPAIGGFEIRL